MSGSGNVAERDIIQIPYCYEQPEVLDKIQF